MKILCKKCKMSEKMPVTILQEHCVQRKVLVPFYEDLGEQLSENSKIFRSRVSALGLSAEGIGLNKKNAKHSAAAALLEKLGIKTRYVNDVEEEKSNAVLRLFDMCIERNWPLAKFEQIQASGPSHCPEFTCRCTLSTIVREATAPKKKDAKQKAAVLILQVIQEMNMLDLDKLKIVEMRDAMDEEDENEEHVIKTYRDYKKSDVKKTLGVKLCDRHKFFANLDPVKVAEAKRCLADNLLSDENKIEEMCHALKLKFEIKDVPSTGAPMMAFELDNDSYDCYFVAFKDVFWKKLIEYFDEMLN
ncbi:interferon-inducible double-stranded RNA-dependent protein kinase activator A homolog isoform X1 [Culicoides brevitarsis]|uniref:interferon-inducible double-stranded RNA-dependent protein kinase activator A homolog isoform X1 n=1 Tax=Culicoides brevitarsis TaxID=469753 RepID=UPI00307B88BA